MSNAAARGRQAHRDGDVGEMVARVTLQGMGLEMIEKIHTPWKVIFKTLPGGGRKVVNAFPLEKVAGDFRAVYPRTGQSVLIEVKSRMDRDTFRWSDLEPHQRESLDNHWRLGGLSLVVWVIESGEAIVLPWPIEGLSRGKSVSWDAAVDIQWTGVPREYYGAI